MSSIAEPHFGCIVEGAVTLCFNYDYPLNYMQKERVIISLGGSLVVPDAIDTVFLASFKTLVSSLIAEGFSFVVIVGGGKTARKYQDAARALGNPPEDDLDWIGIQATRINAQLLRSVFKGIARENFIKDPTLPIEGNDSLIIAAGWKPGRSTDYCAVTIAKNLNAKKIINLSNIEYVYESDPKKNPDAKKFEYLSWKEFRALIPTEWSPGLSSPFDPIAAKEADEAGMEIAVISGTHLEEIQKYVKGESFVGTHIN